jgi:hydrogenase expression/formation protein HypC
VGIGYPIRRACNSSSKLVDRPVHPRRKGSGHVCLAIPGQVLEIVDNENRLAKVDVAGVKRTVNVGLLDGEEAGARPGDWVLIHVGFALSKVDEDEAFATLELLQGMGEEYEQELEELKASVIE